MLKVYLSHPVETIYTDEEHAAYIDKMKNLLKLLLDEDEIEVIDSRIDDFDFSKYRRSDVALFGETIKLMASADLIVFAEGWERTRGCPIQHEIADELNLPYIELTTENKCKIFCV